METEKRIVFTLREWFEKYKTYLDLLAVAMVLSNTSLAAWHPSDVLAIHYTSAVALMIY